MKRMIAATLMFSLLLSATACGKAPFKSFLLGRACPKPARNECGKLEVSVAYLDFI